VLEPEPCGPAAWDGFTVATRTFAAGRSLKAGGQVPEAMYAARM